MVRHLLPLVALLSTVGCAPEPGGTDVSELNYEITRMRDAQAATCHHAAIEDEIEDTMTDLGLVACNVAIGTPADGVVMITSKRLTDFTDETDLPLFTPPNITFAWDTPMTAGSVSKMVTAQAFLELWAQGEVAIEYIDDGEGGFVATPAHLDDILLDDVLDLPDDWPFWVGQITMKELLTHTSGISEMTYGRWEWYDASDTAVPLVAGTDTITDDEGLLDLPAGALAGISNPGGHPRFAFRALIPPATMDYDLIAEGEAKYSNVNYLLLGAVIDHIVTKPGFGGYGSGPYAVGGLSGLEAGFESYAWWVASDGATQHPGSLLTPALQVDFRVPTASIPGIPYSYSNKADVLAQAPKWSGSGYEGPAGAWTMTIGDQIRLVAVLAGGPTYARLHDEAAKLYRKDNMAIDVGGTYGYGLQFLSATADGTAYDLRGHGGAIYGYTGGTYQVSPAGTTSHRYVAIACNTHPYAKDVNGVWDSVVYYPDMAARIRDAWGSTPPVCSPKVAPGLSPGQGVLADGTWSGWAASVNTSIARYGHASTYTTWIRALDDGGYGTRALDAVEDGDFAQAADCALLWAGDRSGKWSCR